MLLRKKGPVIMRSRLRRYMPPGIRLQLACWYTLSFTILLLLTGVVFYAYLESSLEAGVDSALQIRAQQVAGGIEIEHGTVLFHNVTGDLPGFGSKTSHLPIQPDDVNYGALVRLFDAHGTLVGETPAFRQLRVPERSVTQPLHGQPWQGTVLSDRNQEVRLYSRTLTYRGEVLAVIQVGESLTQLHTLLHRLVAALLLTGGVVLLICAAGSYWLAARSFAPIRQLAEAARRIKTGDLHQRVPIPRPHDEIQYLALTLNDMLNSLEQAFSRQRRFVADASHELRTPVAVIRNKASIALLDTLTLTEAMTVLHEIRGETERLSQLISDLLALARGDEEQAHFERELVQFDLLVKTVAATAEPLATERGIHLEVEAPDPVMLTGDEARLMQVVMNLLDNAIRYTNPGGRVTVAVEKTAQAAHLMIRDTGIGIAAEHLPHIFERFYRVNAARSQAGGSGLGLAIVAWVVHAHGGSIDVVSQVGAGSCFTIVLPLLPSNASSATEELISPGESVAPT
jgi:heavy metal sensor kinase